MCFKRNVELSWGFQVCKLVVNLVWNRGIDKSNFNVILRDIMKRSNDLFVTM